MMKEENFSIYPLCVASLAFSFEFSTLRIQLELLAFGFEDFSSFLTFRKKCWLENFMIDGWPWNCLFIHLHLISKSQTPNKRRKRWKMFAFSFWRFEWCFRLSAFSPNPFDWWLWLSAFSWLSNSDCEWTGT